VNRSRQQRSGCAAALAVAALAVALAAAGCGKDEATTTREAPVATTPEPEPEGGPSAPPSAGEGRPPAPDDVIQDRPGGPGGGGAGGGQQTRAPSETDARLIETAVKRYIAALNSDDGRELCALFAPGALRGVRLPERRGSCAATLRASVGHPPPDGAPRWLGTRLVDADSVVLVQGGDGRLTGTVVHRFAGGREPSIEEDVVYLRRAGGGWLLAKPSATFHRAIGARDVPITALTPPR
jgi:hypothetical protein